MGNEKYKSAIFQNKPILTASRNSELIVAYSNTKHGFKLIIINAYCINLDGTVQFHQNFQQADNKYWKKQTKLHHHIPVQNIQN